MDGTDGCSGAQSGIDQVLTVYRGTACDKWDQTHVGATSWTPDRATAELYAEFYSCSPEGYCRNPVPHLWQAELEFDTVYDLFPKGPFQAWEQANVLWFQMRVREVGIQVLRYMEEVPKLGKRVITFRPLWHHRITRVKLI